MYNPVSTYRIQFHKQFTFNDFERIIPYLHELGIVTIYASPIFEATPGSTHGYDVVNPLRINPEIGTLDELTAIHQKLSKFNMGWVQDIVPNHMAYDQNNSWLMDVLEKGNRSAYANYFDILWDSELYNGRIMVPVLGATLGDVLKDKELKLVYHNNQLGLNYSGQHYPVNLQTYLRLLQNETAAHKYNEVLKDIENAEATQTSPVYTTKVDAIKTKYATLLSGLFTPAYLNKINSNVNLLSAIADEQNYQLCFWQETDKHINFRRFFTVNGLICLNIQHQQVFDEYHTLIKNLLDKGIFQGLRVDHIDGLFDPQQYLTQLRNLTGPDTYIIVEKILEQGEGFPASWPVQGNTGYDFLAAINNLFTNNKSEHTFTKLYSQIIGNNTNAADDIPQKKALILYEHMAGELENLYRLFINLKLADGEQINSLKPGELKEAIAQLLIACPVYRFYGNVFPLNADEAENLHQLFNQVNEQNPELKNAINLLSAVLLNKSAQVDTEQNKRTLYFYQRLMQFTGPLMAKGVEDTLMYTYNRFINHNEVGDSPEVFGIKTTAFHNLMLKRQQNWPLSMNATSTHDTKRGEDVRARLNVLTNIPDEWFEQVKLWQQLNIGLKTDSKPDINDEYFIYQTLVGSSPLPGENDDDFENRAQDYFQKAFREAKRKTNWADPDNGYEEAVKTFVKKLLDINGDFLPVFTAFKQKALPYGILNSLTQVLLKFTCPGLPDLYQGCELWDFSMVDPDNRRPVDYEKRNTYLNEHNTFDSQAQLWDYLIKYSTNAQIKLHLTKTLLNIRKQNASLFNAGHYIPLTIKGEYKKNILAFARHTGQQWCVIALPLHVADIMDENDTIENFNWQDTHITLPDTAPKQWEHLLFKTKGNGGSGIYASDIFKPYPLAVLKLSNNERGAGILMHITSLPSDFGIGDIGPQAYNFADFLNQGGQKFWQMLPVNTVQPDSGHSPYSSGSSIAGNTLLISPEILLEDGLLQKKELKKYRTRSGKQVDFKQAAKIKADLLHIAHQRFLKQTNIQQQQKFVEFKKSEAHWLDDFAMYECLKNKFKGSPWYNWPQQYKLYNTAELKKLEQQENEYLENVKWLQFIFAGQWARLKTYCNKKNIQLVGDIPFYVSYDSADVWSKQKLFKVDDDGNIKGVAGVPPDYFSTDGQLWGMPVYNWTEMKTDGYEWWLQRIKKNLEYFDWIRLDHFRAFIDYWDVPAGEKTAVNGSWQPGPGKDFFACLQKRFGKLPLVAEDLGDINEAVYALRDDFDLPGMRVLQFAIGNDLPTSVHAPHNYTANSFAYTGTHDNNTIVGWYKTEIGKHQRKLIENYTGQKIRRRNVHQAMIKMVYSSVANTVIVPMQDILALDERSRMNIPSSAQGNWGWRIKAKDVSKKNAKQLKQWVTLYNR